MNAWLFHELLPGPVLGALPFRRHPFYMMSVAVTLRTLLSNICQHVRRAWHQHPASACTQALTGQSIRLLRAAALMMSIVSLHALHPAVR